MKELRDWRLNLPEDKRSLKAAAAILGVSDSQLCRYEQGKRAIAPERVPHISKITGISPRILRPDVFGPFVLERPRRVFPAGKYAIRRERRRG